MIEYEVKMAEFRKTNEEKMMGQKEKEKERAKELIKKRQIVFF